MADPRFRVRIAQAARLAGIHKTTIIRAIHRGKLSASVANDGTKRIDVAELERVYGQLRTGAETVASDGAQQVQSGAGVAPDQAELLAELRRQITAADQREAQLRRDLDAERDERRRLVAVIERQSLLLDHRPDDRDKSISTPRPKRSRTKAPDPQPPTLADLAGAVWSTFTGRR